MSIRSHIDWNELFPMLPKQLRDTMLLEAVTVLSKAGQPPRRNRALPGGITDEPNASLPNSLRTWARDGDGKRLAGPWRHYRIIVSRTQITKGEIKGIWEAILATGKDFIAYEGILKICKQDKILTTNSINYLYRTYRLEVQDPATVKAG